MYANEREMWNKPATKINEIDIGKKNIEKYKTYESNIETNATWIYEIIERIFRVLHLISLLLTHL